MVEFTSNTKVNRRQVLTGVTGGATALIAGCSRSSTSDQGDSPNSTATQEPPSEDEIPIGSLFPLTGFWSNNGVVIDGAIQYTVRQINEAGGPLDRDLRLYSGDTRGAKPNAAVQAFNRMANAYNIKALVGPTSATIKAVYDKVRQNDMVAATGVAGTSYMQDRGGEHWFRTVPDDSLQRWGIVMALKQKMGLSSVAQIGVETEASQSIMDSIGGAAEQAGIEVTAKASAPRKVSDVSSTVREALSDNPDGVIFTGTLGQVSSALKTIIREGYSTDDVFFTTEVKTSEVFDAVSDTELIEGVHSASASANVQSDVYESFASDYKEQTGRDSVHPYAVTSYDATNAMALAIHHAETTEDGEKIGQSMRKIGNPPGTKVTTFAEGKEALNAGEKINYQGAATPCNFDKQGNVFGPMAHFKATTSAWEINDIFPASEMSEFLEEHRN